MDVEPGAVIHGVPTSALKAMLKRHKGRFTTPQAMADLVLVEPAATMAMLGLARDGYVDYVGRSNAVDVWETGGLGRRLVASRIGKRFPAREGRRIAEAVVAAAREANADPGSPVRVTWIALFGSTLDAGDEALVGDVDLMVRVHRRRLPKVELRRLEEALLAAAPPSARGGLAPFRSTVAILDRLRRVSPKVSLMSASTLGLGVRHRAIYAYDVGKEAEVPASGRTRTSRTDPDEGGSASEDVPAPPASDARLWPDRPGPRQAPRAGGADVLARGDHLTAQHMWTHGLELDEISARLGVPEWTVQDYLAAQTTRPEGPLVSAASLRATLAANVPAGTALVREARAEIGRGRRSGVQVTLSHGPAACAGTVTGGAVTLIKGDMFLARLVERACAAAERWRQGASKAVRGVATTCQVGPSPVGRGGDAERGVPDLAALGSACENWLRAAGPVRASFGSHGRSLSIEVGDPTGARVGSPWEDRDPTEDPAIMAEAARLNGEIVTTGVRWTFWFSKDDYPVP